MAEVIRSQCWECSTFCGTLVTRDAAGRLRICGNPDHPASKGAFCIKGAAGALALVDAPGRVLHPLVREGPRGAGRWRRASWDEALARAADGLAAVQARYGPLAIAGAVSSAFFSRGVQVVQLLRALGSPNVLINQDLCQGCRSVSDMVTGLDLGGGGEEIERADLVVLVGSNLSASNPSLWLQLKAARRRGAQLVVVDPRRTPAVDLGAEHLAIRPGTDRALALGLLHVVVREALYDRMFVAQYCHGFAELAAHVTPYTPERMAAATGLAPAQIVMLARCYATTPAATLVLGHGLDAQVGGVQTVRAFHILLALTGHLDVPGGNRRAKRLPGFRSYWDFIYAPEYRLDRATEEQILGGREFPLWCGPDGWARACHNPTAIQAMLTGEPYPVRALYVSGVNIAVTYPDTPRTLAALRGLDCLIVATDTMTPVAHLADVVLPKTVALEEEQVQWQPKGPCISYTAAVLPPRGEARNDTDIAVALLDALRARGAVRHELLPWRSHTEFLRAQLGDSGLTLEELRARGYVPIPYQYRDYARFRTPTGKVELYSTRLAQHGLPPLPAWDEADVPPAPPPEYPLLLLTGTRSIVYHHSRFRDHAWARRKEPEPQIHVHPETAAALGLHDGAWVEGRLPDRPETFAARLRYDERVPPGVASTGMGWWLTTPDGAPDLALNINNCTSYGPPWDPVIGCPATRGLPCQLRPLPAPVAGTPASAWR